MLESMYSVHNLSLK